MAILKQFSAGCMQVCVLDSRDAMGRAAAHAAAECLRALLGEKDAVNMIFAAAPSQNETLKYLAAEKDIDWQRVNAFHMDEYIGLPAGAPQAFGRYLKEHIFDLVPFRSVNLIDASATDIDAECARYAALLKEYPADIVCLGIGENGHIAFNDPGVADFNDPCLVKAAELDDICRRQQVNDGCFGSIDEVPAHALTLTIPALTGAKHMICTVPAATKAWAVEQTVNGELSEKVPATIMRRHTGAQLFCDGDSGKALLK